MQNAMNKKALIEVATRMKKLRETNGLTQGELAEHAGIDRKTINRIENGHFSPSLDTFFRICFALSVKPAALVESVKL